MTGTLYLLPVGLGLPESPDPIDAWLPSRVQEISQSLDYFIVENAKTARAWLKHLGYHKPMQQARIEPLPEKTDLAAIQPLLAPLLDGIDAGLMSDAGCPAVADPGMALVRHAHDLGIRVAPQVGPSSLLLALMGSGLNGQGFAFHGYLPVKDYARLQALRQLEQDSARYQRTQLFIETPYRNLTLFEALLSTLSPQTRLCIACDLTTPAETIVTASIQVWRQRTRPNIQKRPTLFLFLA